jgi:hypothetical protein
MFTWGTCLPLAAFFWAGRAPPVGHHRVKHRHHLHDCYLGSVVEGVACETQSCRSLLQPDIVVSRLMLVRNTRTMATLVFLSVSFFDCWSYYLIITYTSLWAWACLPFKFSGHIYACWISVDLHLHPASPSLSAQALTKPAGGHNHDSRLQTELSCKLSLRRSSNNIVPDIISKLLMAD